MVMILESFCGCGELRTGSLIIGYLSLIRDIIMTLISIILLSLNGGRAIWLNGSVIATFCVLLILGILNMMFTSTMLIGIHEYKAVYLKAYLIYNVVITIISVLLTICILNFAELPILILLGLAFLLLHLYCLMVIRSYYLNMDDPQKKPAILNTPEGPLLTAEDLA